MEMMKGKSDLAIFLPKLIEYETQTSTQYNYGLYKNLKVCRKSINFMKKFDYVRVEREGLFINNPIMIQILKEKIELIKTFDSLKSNEVNPGKDPLSLL